MIATGVADQPQRAGPRALGLWSWALYDWANSPFTTLIITFIFPAYFQAAVVGEPVAGQALWGYAISGSGLLIALLAPVLGAIADAGGRRKPWVFVFTAICVFGSALLWFVQPSPGWLGFGLACVVLANVGFEFGVVFNNAMLPELVPEERLGRISGWAWGLGYAGGLAALVIALSIFISPQQPPFGLNRNSAEHVRIVGPLVAVWLAVFALPLFLFTPDRPSSGGGTLTTLRRGLRGTARAFAELGRNRSIATFLLAHMIYADGLATLFAFGGVYAAGAFGLSLSQVVTFGIVLNVAAGAGALAFAWVDDWIGSKRTVIVALIGIIAAAMLAAATTSLPWFWVAGIGIGLFVGPAQAASRSLMARIAPDENRAAYFGLFALSGKATAFVGPAMVAIVTSASGSQRIGLAAIIVFFVIGLIVILPVEEPKRAGARK
jgi:UMF1 family MFS transporter